MVKLDIYWKEKDKKIDLIKADVEGAELLVLKGASNLLSMPANEAPTIIFELCSQYMEHYDYKAKYLPSFLRNLGCSICSLINDSKGVQLKQIDGICLSSPFDIIYLVAVKDL